MTKIDITKTELVWPGKYNEDGTLKEAPRASLPFQVIETVNESRATRVSQQTKGMSLFDVYQGNEGNTFEEGWKNKLIWGDNLLVMSSLLEKFAGKIDLIYIDPPFATGADYSFKTEIGVSADKHTKEPSIIEQLAYRDTWRYGISSYLDMMRKRLIIMRELLKDTGSIYIHLDATVGHYVKILMDELFGLESFQREIIWRIGWISGYKSVAKNWIRNHDTILFYVKTPSNFTFNKEYVPYADDYKRRGDDNKSTKGYPIEDVWNANSHEFQLKGEESLDSIQIKSFSQEKTGYQTQKNESVLRRIITASSNPNDLVADFFCGSGTTLAVSEKLGRRWIGCDLGRWGIHTTRKRLLNIEHSKPFELLNLGKYERQHWQVTTFNKTDTSKQPEQLLYEYYAFILKLYGAQPISDLGTLHGKKGRALVHIGAVDAPVTIDEIEQSIKETVIHKQTNLHVLGWEWEMGLSGSNRSKGNLMRNSAKQNGINLSLFQIPREVMQQKWGGGEGEVQFFELSYLEAEIANLQQLTMQVLLKDFVIPNTDLVPDEGRNNINQWSDYIDYWAVDWDFQNDTFIYGWVDYRTRKDRNLRLESDPYTYEKPGKYHVLIKVIDIFGNDTSQRYDIEIE